MYASVLWRSAMVRIANFFKTARCSLIYNYIFRDGEYSKQSLFSTARCSWMRSTIQFVTGMQLDENTKSKRKITLYSIQFVTGKQWVFEIYSEMAEIIKGCKTDNNGTVVQGNHKYYR